MTNILSPLEEKVIRMRHGLSEPDDHVLAFAVDADDETRTRLALLEKAIYSTFYSKTEDVK